MWLVLLFYFQYKSKDVNFFDETNNWGSFSYFTVSFVGILFARTKGWFLGKQHGIFPSDVIHGIAAGIFFAGGFQLSPLLVA